MRARDIIEFIEDFAPLDLQDSWDNCGLQLGDRDRRISRLILALDYDREVFEIAKRDGTDMIITHHPVIFKGLKSLTSDDYMGRLLMDTIREDIVVYSSHTSLDKSSVGINDILGQLLGLHNREILRETDILHDQAYGYGQVGDIEEVALADYVQFVKRRLDLDYVTLWGNIDRPIKRVAVVGGSGADFIGDAYKKAADLLVTGDIKYHQGQEADRLGMAVLDAGHFYTEDLILPVIGKKLLGFNPDLKIGIYNKPSPIYNIY